MAFSFVVEDLSEDFKFPSLVHIFTFAMQDVGVGLSYALNNWGHYEQFERDYIDEGGSDAVQGRQEIFQKERDDAAWAIFEASRPLRRRTCSLTCWTHYCKAYLMALRYFFKELKGTFLDRRYKSCILCLGAGGQEYIDVFALFSQAQAPRQILTFLYYFPRRQRPGIH